MDLAFARARLRRLLDGEDRARLEDRARQLERRVHADQVPLVIFLDLGCRAGDPLC